MLLYISNSEKGDACCEGFFNALAEHDADLRQAGGRRWRGRFQLGEIMWN